MKGIFFDLGGTLFSYRNVARNTIPILLQVIDRLDLGTGFDDVKRAHNQAMSETTIAYAEKSYYLHSDFFRDVFYQFVKNVGGCSDKAVCTWYLETHRMAMIDCLELKDDCIETLMNLKAQGFYLSIVSNIDEDMLHPLVQSAGLDAYLDDWLSSEAARSCKPHRRIFEHALNLSGLDAKSILFVGDSPEHDVLGAGSIGMKTALIIDGGMEPPLQTGRDTAEPDYVIQTLNELREIAW